MSTLTFDAAREAIYGALSTAWASLHSSVPIQYENRPGVDLAAQPGPFVDVAVYFTSGRQASMGSNPVKRRQGAIHVSVSAIGDSGTADSLKLLGDLGTILEIKNFSGVVTGVGDPLPGRPFKGRYIETLRVPFQFDEIPS